MKKQAKNNNQNFKTTLQQILLYLKINKVNIFLYLLMFYTCIAFVFNSDNFMNLFLSLSSLIILTGVGYAIFKVFDLSTPKFSTMLISILIIFLILFPDEYSFEFAITQVLLITGLFLVKYIRINKKPVMNPATFAFIFASLISLLIPSINGVFISWWGASFGGYIGFFSLLPAVLFAGYYFKKWPLLLGFFVTQFLILFISSSQFSVLSLTLFLAGIMLLEIKTSPIKLYEQIVYGIVGALLVSFTPSLLQIDNHILAIAQTNVLYVVYREGRRYFKI
ncbi:MAG: hypothetical protein ACLFPL_00015 [Candidatus Nanoarchaeia archaeon]